jgi:ribosomal protein L12E/L44/L45/RPP1/RPP2
MDGVDEEKLDLLVRWMTEVDEMITAAMEPPPPAPSAMSDLKAAMANQGTEQQGGQVPNQQGTGLPGQENLQVPAQQQQIK